MADMGFVEERETEMNTPKPPPVINSCSGLAQSLSDRRAVVDQDETARSTIKDCPCPRQ